MVRVEMSAENEKRYQERLDRYVTAMRGGQPDTVPIRPFVAEFTAKVREAIVNTSSARPCTSTNRCSRRWRCAACTART